MRFGSIEFGANTGMCRNLKIKRLPTVHFYQNGQQLDGFPCGPSKFPILVNKIAEYLEPGASLKNILRQGDELVNSDEVAGVLQRMIEQDARGALETKAKGKPAKKQKWWNVLP